MFIENNFFICYKLFLLFFAVTETKTLNSTSIKSKSSTSFQRPTLVARLSHKKSSSQAVGTGGGGIKKGDDSNKKGSKEAQNQKEEIM